MFYEEETTDFGLDDIGNVDFDEDNDIISDDKNNKEDLKLSLEKITLPVLTKYEKSMIISKRAKQLDNGYKTTIPEVVKNENITKSSDIAIKEYSLKSLPSFIIRRKINNKQYEEWKLEDFKYYS